MFVNFTRVTTGDEPIENAAIVGEEMERWLRSVDGFLGFVILSREGTSVGLSFWESREAAERHRALRMQFIERVMATAGVVVEEIVEYDVAFARLGAISAGPTPERRPGA